MLWADGHSTFRKKLSPYIDGRLKRREAADLEAHLRTCEGCARELEELRRMVAALRELPRARAPRSFALTPEQVSGPVRPPARAPSFPPVAAGMRIAAAGLA